MTPAIASEPYCADAPSRSTSIDCTIEAGIVFKSTAAAPRPIVPLTLTSDDAWRRFEFMSTSVWSGDSPRNVAGRIVSVPSARPGRGKLNDGSITESAWLISVTPTLLIDSPLTTSTGTAVSVAERSGTRVPVTTICSISMTRGALASCAAAATGPSAATSAAFRNVGRIFLRCTVDSFPDGGIRLARRFGAPYGTLGHLLQRSSGDDLEQRLGDGIGPMR